MQTEQAYSTFELHRRRQGYLGLVQDLPKTATATTRSSTYGYAQRGHLSGRSATRLAILDCRQALRPAARQELGRELYERQNQAIRALRRDKVGT